MQYRLDGGDWTAYAAPVALPAGSYDVDWRARLPTGSGARSGRCPVKVDDTPPVVTGAAVRAHGDPHRDRRPTPVSP